MLAGYRRWLAGKTKANGGQPLSAEEVIQQALLEDAEPPAAAHGLTAEDVVALIRRETGASASESPPAKPSARASQPDRDDDEEKAELRRQLAEAQAQGLVARAEAFAARMSAEHRWEAKDLPYVRLCCFQALLDDAGTGLRASMVKGKLVAAEGTASRSENLEKLLAGRPANRMYQVVGSNADLNEEDPNARTGGFLGAEGDDDLDEIGAASDRYADRMAKRRKKCQGE